DVVLMVGACAWARPVSEPDWVAEPAARAGAAEPPIASTRMPAPRAMKRLLVIKLLSMGCNGSVGLCAPAGPRSGPAHRKDGPGRLPGVSGAGGSIAHPPGRSGGPVTIRPAPPRPQRRARVRSRPSAEIGPDGYE